MRLLNTSTFQLRWLTEDEPTPPYAALSHCWTTDEVVYGDLQNTGDLSQKHGFQKLMGACREAFGSYKLDWLWADTVCIDRSSSAELSESINSMYRWYRNCSICIAYLGDVCDSEPSEEVLVKSRWMQRSWTLIELIAPRQVQFYNADWSLIGTKESLISTLSRITQIDQAVLEDAESLSDISIGKRMSWAAQRSARKIEDVAYSLIGIFGISMDVIYGEETRAFMRLQEELVRTLDDASLFAWTASDDQQYRGLLARSPSEFGHFSQVKYDTRPWRLPTTLRLTFTTPILTCSLAANRSGAELLLPLSEISDKPGCYGGRGIRLCMWQGELVRSSPQHLFDVSTNVSSGTQDIPMRRDVDARKSKFIAQYTPNEPQHYFTQVFGSQSEDPLPNEHHVFSFSPVDKDYSLGDRVEETNSEWTGPVWSAAAKSSSDIDTLQEPPLRFKMTTGETSRATTPNCDNTSVTLALEDDMSDESGDYELCLLLSPDLESQSMDLDPLFAGLTDELAKTALGRFSTWMSTRSASCKRPQNVDSLISKKRFKPECFSKHIPVESHEMAGEDDTIFVEISGSRPFACPFYVQDKNEHLQCLTRYDLRTIRDLKQHLWISHRQPYYCPTCGINFSRASTRDEHIKRRACSREQWKGPPQGLSEGKLQRLAKRCMPGTSDRDQWYGIWSLIYPETDMPSPREAPETPYLTGEIESAVCVVRDFWSREGKLVIAAFLESRNLRDYGVPDEERNLSALYHITLDNVVDELLRKLREDDCYAVRVWKFCSKMMRQ